MGQDALRDGAWGQVIGQWQPGRFQPLCHRTNLARAQFVLAQQQGDPDLDNNNSANATAYYAARADVAVSKSDNPDPVPAGQVLTYTITASNPAATSASRAYGVSITDTLPADERKNLDEVLQAGQAGIAECDEEHDGWWVW